ncbi:PIN domain-containing protein [Sphingomonas sp. Leaf21]|jgi:predicted nucleic acid-binding protein|uniref:PIN domain-containing protein n=1 Tax=Sphingomonas sp. Leaf21 TaxID=2876550 RepID=UPI001E599B5A|nr:PIN domain-containing protein [Sphingomonas sp. Leaf21]
MYLLDTPILLDLAKARAGGGDPGLVGWAGGIARERLFVSAISLVELEDVAVRTARRDKSAAAGLRSWIGGQLLSAFDGHVLPLDTGVARRRGEVPLTDTRDALLAATALHHGLTLVTTNVAGFKGVKLRLFDPSTYRVEDRGDEGDWRSATQARPPWLRSLFIRG